jgi:hypothetical protein
MNNYELKQSILDKMEIEGLIQRIKKLENELAEKELAIKMLKKDLEPFETEKEKRRQYLEKRNMIDEKINQMLYNLHNTNK